MIAHKLSLPMRTRGYSPLFTRTHTRAYLYRRVSLPYLSPRAISRFPRRRYASPEQREIKRRRSRGSPMCASGIYNPSARSRCTFQAFTSYRYAASLLFSGNLGVNGGCLSCRGCFPKCCGRWYGALGDQFCMRVIYMPRSAGLWTRTTGNFLLLSSCFGIPGRSNRFLL